MSKVFHASLHGLSSVKERELSTLDLTTTQWSHLDIESSNFYLFIPQNNNLLPEYNRGWKVTDIFPVNGVGMTTARDHVVINFEKAPILERAQIFRDSLESDREVCNRLSIPLKLGWNISRARRLIQAEDDLKQHIKPIAYRPFDCRHIFYHDSLVWRTVKKVMQHMLAGDNLALVTCRQQSQAGEWGLCGVTNTIIESCSISNKTKEINSLFPLYLYPTTKAETDINTSRLRNLERSFPTKFQGIQPSNRIQFGLNRKVLRQIWELPVSLTLPLNFS